METHELHIEELGEYCWPLMGTRNLYVRVMHLANVDLVSYYHQLYAN